MLASDATREARLLSLGGDRGGQPTSLDRAQEVAQGERLQTRRLLLPELFAVRCSARARMNGRTVSSAQHYIVASDRGAGTTPVWAHVCCDLACAFHDPLTR